MSIMVRIDKVTGRVDSCHCCDGCEKLSRLANRDQPKKIPYGWEERRVPDRTPTGRLKRGGVSTILSLCPKCKKTPGDPRPLPKARAK